MQTGTYVPTLDQVNQELARRSHLRFIQYMWQRTEPLLIGQHTQIICERIDRAIKDFSAGKSTFLKVMVPFRHGKSDMVSRYLPANFIGKFPDEEVIVAAYSSNLAADFSKFARRLVRTDEFQGIYPDVQISREEQAVDQWGIEGRLGKINWVGIGGSITGRGGSLIIVDDFFKSREEAESEVIREKVWESFTNEILTRRAPRCIVIVLATPWHCDDLFGRIDRKMEEDDRFPRFEELKFPAKSDQYDTGYLFPERFTESWYEEQFATLGPYASAALMQCDPVVRHGNLFRVDKIQFYDEPPQDVQYTRGWDLASSEKQRVKDDPDYTAGIRLGVRWLPTAPGVAPMPVLYIDDLVIGRWLAAERDQRIKDTAMNDGNLEIGVEAYGPYKDAFAILQSALWGVRKVTKVQMPGDKVARASVLEPIFEAGNVYMRKASWNDKLIRFFAEFPGGAHDDPVDAAVTAFALHKPFIKHVWPAMAELRPVPFDIKWGRQNERNSRHYAAAVQRRDLSINVMGILWDDVSGQLFIYDAAEFDEPDVPHIVNWMIGHLKLHEYKLDRILCNRRMADGKDEAKSVDRLFREEFKRKKVAQGAMIVPLRYDQWGSIAQVARLAMEHRIFVSDDCQEALSDFQRWTVEKGKPTSENNGYSEALCHVVSELKRKNVFRHLRKPIDYMKKERLEQILKEDKMAKNREQTDGQ